MSGTVPIPCFKEEEEDFDSFRERLECYFTVKEVPADKKVHTLIIGLSPRQYQVLKDLVSPSTPSSLQYDVVMQRLVQHFGGKSNARVERTKFRATIRADGETIQQFAVRLKHSSRHCEFGASLDQMLVDQLVARIHYKCATNKLLEATDGLNLTFNKAVEVAEAAIVNEENSQMYVKAADNKSEMHTVSVKGEYSRSFNPSVRAKSFGPKPNLEKPRSDFSLPRSKANPNLTRPKSDLHMQDRGKMFSVFE